MRVLIAEDDRVSRKLLSATLSRFGYEVIATDDGAQALEILLQDNGPRMAILDWMMPKLDGVEVCQRVREHREGPYRYLLFLTAKAQTKDVVTGLEAGADDYLVKPFNPQELKSRLDVGRRILQLQADLASKVDELQHALYHVKQLQGLLPICMHCKKIRDDDETWHRLESYLEKHSELMFTHSLCQECLVRHYPQHTTT